MCEVLQSVKEQLTDIENECLLSNENDEDILKAAEPCFLNMPVEIILKICSFLDPYFLKHTFSKVSKRFEIILADDHLWKYWVYSKVGGCYPVLPNLKHWDDNSIDWENVCIEMEVESKKWNDVKKSMKHIVVKDVHFASVDTVYLVNNGEICISGGRDRGMAVWNVHDIKPQDPNENSITLTDAKPKHIRHDAHSGWVWDLAANNIQNATVIYSASWDNTVKAWDLDSGFKCFNTFRCGMSALSVISSENIVTAGLYSKKILTFDIRAGTNPIDIYIPHKGPVLGLSSLNHNIASISEDKTLAIYDRVAGKLLVKNVKLPTERAYPVCISWSPFSMYIGDSKGSIHLIDPEKFVYIKMHELWPETPINQPSNKIIGCHQSQGNMIVGSDRGEIKFLFNCSPPKEYASVKTSTFDVTQLRYLNGILVTGTCDSALEFWIPSEQCD